MAANHQNREIAKARIACFVQGATTPSSRFRILQYLPKLRGRGIDSDVFVVPPGPAGWTNRALPGPLYHLARRVSQVGVYLPRRFLQLRFMDLEGYDAIFLQKQLSPPRVGAPLERYVSGRNPRITFDVDDAIFAGAEGASRGAMAYFEEVCRLSRYVTAGNQFLAGYVPKGPEVAVLSTTVDEEKFVPAKAAKLSRPVCIGWTGSGSNLRYLRRLRPVLKALVADGARIRIICNRIDVPELAGVPNVEFVTWNADTEVRDLQDIDIGIMPLRDNIWTRGKCAFKLVQYMAIGIPAVASPVGANNEILEHEVTGFFAESNEEWQRALLRLVRDSDLRRRMGRSARKRFLDTLSLSDNASRLSEILLQVARS